jgi:predicted neutral ceramidase superfamily lipid hydrolase
MDCRRADCHAVILYSRKSDKTFYSQAQLIRDSAAISNILYILLLLLLSPIQLGFHQFSYYQVAAFYTRVFHSKATCSGARVKQNTFLVVASLASIATILLGGCASQTPAQESTAAPANARCEQTGSNLPRRECRSEVKVLEPNK